MSEPFVVRPRPAATRVAPAPGSGAGAPAATAVAARPLGRSGLQHPDIAPLASFLDDPDVTDVFVNGEAGLFVDRGGGAQLVAQWRASEAEVRRLAVALIGRGGRHIDDAAPCVDVRLEDGVRVHAVLPPVSTGGTVISIRVPRLQRPDLAALEALGMFDAPARARLEGAVARRENLLVTGAAGAGKTTLLAALLGSAQRHERIVTIEDVAELRLDHPHHIRLEARQPNLEGAGAVGMARLVREALRMRPDRLVVGECRGEEVRELLGALNTGHDGGAGTLHANGLHDVAARLEALGALAGLDDHALARQVASAIDRVLHVARGADGVRRLAGVGRPVIDSAGRLAIEEAAWQG
ncbi:TadA family conjugal transfer-associated ATPase [Microbacterium terricola]|uniref:Bacterial type II secretion system protein E domain-containing protein n=1 Tax=Microbacterium terricola TaxID=344163 RepID=A0ABM8E0Q4_9MICO|nr:TadA family conjugal transfer-associated ATPase [Microbacterium terricola]UYK40884.1 TadA family conjugal transfer-associated ATPase [Microbacterium terricola]BDV31366.1 hypothetical protein Microterr_20260 [Microbacterium terricola]